MRQELKRIALRISLWYGLIVAAWFLIAEELVSMLIQAGLGSLLAHGLKDALFIGLSVWQLYRLLVIHFERWETAASKAHDPKRLHHAIEMHLRQFSDALPELAWIARPDGKDVYLNHHCVAFFGLYDKTSRDFPVDRIHPDDQAQYLAQRDQAMSAGTALRAALRMRRHDGHYRWFECSLLPLGDAVGKVVGWLGLYADITEQRELALRADENESRNRKLLTALADGVFVAQDHRFVYCNPAMPAMLGYTEEEFVGLRFDQVVTQEFLPLWLDRYEKRIAAASEQQEPTKHYEVRWLRKGGDRMWIELRANRIEYNKKPAVLGIVRDITERKRAQTAQLHSQKLEALGTLAGGIAHDFNNILLAISGNTRLAKTDLASDHPAQESLDQISKASRRATELVQRILAFGRSQEQARQILSLPIVISEALSLVRTTVSSGIVLRSEVADEVPSILGDAGQIHQVIVNLATNAVHAVGPAGGLIEFRLSGLDVEAELAATLPGLKPGRYARLLVTDNGCGMDRATLDRIFDPFFTTKPVGEGTGLGLATVQGIVKSHDGAITVYSEPGRGSTFLLYFPAATGGAPATAEDATDPPRVHGGHVLHVDDDPDIAFLMRRWLERLGYKVSSYTEPQEALAAFEASPMAFDVVVTDLTMPGLSGLQLAARITERRSDLPVVVISGYVRPEDQDNARRAGARAVILKPNTIDELADLLEKLLDRAS